MLGKMNCQQNTRQVYLEKLRYDFLVIEDISHIFSYVLFLSLSLYKVLYIEKKLCGLKMVWPKKHTNKYSSFIKLLINAFIRIKMKTLLWKFNGHEYEIITERNHVVFDVLEASFNFNQIGMVYKVVFPWYLRTIIVFHSYCSLKFKIKLTLNTSLTELNNVYSNTCKE